MGESKYTVYGFRTPNNMYYVGVTSQNLSRRWRNGTRYEWNNELTDAINLYGWDNIEKAVIAECLSKEEALKIEDKLILLYHNLNCTLNRYRSGLISVEDRSEYSKNWYKNNQESVERSRQKQRDKYANDEEYAESVRQRQRDRYANDQGYAESMRERNREWHHEKYANDKDWAERKHKRDKQWRSTPQGRIYDRVHAFNQRHPDRMIETALEARDKYLESGYIPDYIKNDDLCYRE